MSRQASLLLRVPAAAALYVLAVFALGFLLGPIREFWLAPRLGASAATLAEAPVMLGFAWWMAGVAVRRCALPPGAPRWAMGGFALALVLLLEFVTGALLRGWDPAAWLAHVRSPPGWLSLALYGLFALWPGLQRQPRPAKP